MDSKIDSELIGILSNLSLRTDARLQGWEYVLGLTVTDEGLNHIIKTNKYIPFILDYIQQDKVEKELTNIAYKCLINISNRERGATALLKIKEDLCEYLFRSICLENSLFIQSKCYVLSNLSAYSEIDKMIDLLVSSEDLLQNLMKAYCSSESEVRNQYDFLTLVFANISKVPSGRRLFLQDTNFMTSIVTFLNATEPEVRRLGVALILRNCCFEKDYHEKLLNDLAIVPVLLLPLMDSKEYKEEEADKLPVECLCLEESKEREKNPSVRRILVQALTALCYSEMGWNRLHRGVYYVLRDLDLWEKNEKVKDDIQDFVPYYLADYYSLPKDGANCSEDDPALMQELEMNIIRDLPDFVV